MLARKFRLRKNSDFQKLYKKGRRFTSPNLAFYYLPTNLENSQIGFVVSKKVSKKSVVRNKLRRRLSAVVEDNFLKIPRTIKAAFLIRNDFSDIKPTDLQKEVNELINKIR